jgi:hypothetical protein
MDNSLENIGAQLWYLTHDETIALGCAWLDRTLTTQTIGAEWRG